MSHSDVLLGDVETLRRLRRHRADRAERSLREAKRAQQTLLAHIEQASDTLEESRQDEARESAQLLSHYQGQVMTLQALKTWGAQERVLSANTRRDKARLEALQGQQEEKAIRVGSAQKQVTECLRQVEKLQELSLLLAQEPT
ncbi:type III secretion system stalk subunit SctO [Pseudomonas sp. BIGb0164]|uniref:type III secretion system stalk subunit SctO n=1 Tax=Pseudomonas sp. BIGb0164 TaxID=2940605 RepID=UPI002169E7C9|nr:YscO family type III secretion system apparatus protein [Pseudomonas sp. BIGb0164]MCS4247222.1 cellobiose-specific phosphotransferase system component IIA [Pseudomonas sp. BIGb0164]